MKGDRKRRPAAGVRPEAITALQAFSRSAGVIAAAIGGVVLIGGWLFDMTRLRSIPLGSVSMKANTALGLVAGGIALWSLQEGAGGFRRGAGRFCAALTAVIGILTLAEYGLARNLGIDELLFSDRGVGAGLLPGRPSLNAALAFLLLGLAFLMLERRTRLGSHFADGFAVGAGFIALSGLVGLTIDREARGAFLPFSAIAVHTAIAILVLSVGLLAARPGRGVMRNESGGGAEGGASGTLRGVFVCALGLFLAATGTVWESFSLMQERDMRLASTHEVQANLNRLLSLVQDVETGARGFVITGDQAFLEPFESGVAALAQQQRRLDEMVRDEEMKSGVAALEPLIAERVRLARDSVELRQSQGFEAARKLEASGMGKVSMDAIRSHVSQLNERQRALLEQRFAAVRREVKYVTWLIAAVSCLSSAMLIVVFSLLFRENRLRREANLALLESEMLFRNFFELSPDLVCISDIVHGHFRRVNKAFSNVLGYSEEELLATPLMEFIHPDDWAETARVIAEQLDRGETVLSFENRYLRRDGEPVWLEWSAQPIQERGLSFGIARDITARRQAEMLIQQLSVESRERAVQLEQANRELETFSYSVSHDLRAPLRHIQGYVEMLTEALAGKLTGEAPRYLKTIRDASMEMAQLIDDLLAFSRAGRVEYSERRASLDTLVAGVLQKLERVRPDREVVWKIAPLPDVVGDPSMLKQVLANLLDNALKYSRGRNPAEIEIGCAGEEEGRSILFVRDNGVGFDMQYAQKLFGVFQRLHRADQFEGTGIGLALVRRIIARHGGRTWAEGVLDQGATFYFTLQPANAIGERLGGGL